MIAMDRPLFGGAGPRFAPSRAMDLSQSAGAAPRRLHLGLLVAFAGLAFFVGDDGAWAEGLSRPERDACAQSARAAGAPAGGVQAGSAEAGASGSQPPQMAATPPAEGASSGTAPGSEGSTGWTGGTGGTHTGTTPQAPTPGSPSWHPQTVQGLDPKVEPEAEAC